MLILNIAKVASVCIRNPVSQKLHLQITRNNLFYYLFIYFLTLGYKSVRADVLRMFSCSGREHRSPISLLFKPSVCKEHSIKRNLV